jgi:hypothetical protein
MKQLKQLAIFLACLALCPAAASADCQLSFDGQIAQQPLTYNPFQAGAATATISFTIKNAASKPCMAAFSLFKLGSPQANSSGASLAYRILGVTGGSITQSAASPPDTLNTIDSAALIMLAANASITANATLSVPSGQVIGPGTYTDLLILGVYQSPSGRAPYTKAFEAPLNISINVHSQVTLAVAGGGRYTTLDFGNLVEGAVRSVQLWAYANQGFHLSVSSENAGVMKPINPLARAEGWRVPYTIAIFHTPPIDLAQQQLSLWPNATKRTGLSIPEDVRAGSTKGQRAGMYRDVITIAVDPGP